jgi:two-component system, OmpR family, response regulator CpxR
VIRLNETMARESTPTAAVTTPSVAILLIDDDIELCELMREFFDQHGIRLEAVHDGRRGLAQALHGGHDLILLDVMMPGLDGFELLRQVRRRSPIPVIVLTARTAQADRILGLDAGADDYLPKPFGPEELLARVRAVLRRVDASWQVRAEVLELGPVRVAPATREAWCDERPLGLTSIEFDILELLVRSAGRAVSRDEVMTILHQRRITPFDRSLDVHVSHIRKKLGRRGAMIRTVRGVGYFFGAESDGGAEP